MSAWFHYCNSLGSTDDVSKSVLMKKAFNAGLEAAAQVADMEPSGVMSNIVTAQNIAERIRALKDS